MKRTSAARSNMDEEEVDRQAQILALKAQLAAQRRQLDAMKGLPATEQAYSLQPATLRKVPKQYWPNPAEQRPPRPIPSREHLPPGDENVVSPLRGEDSAKEPEAVTEIERRRRQVVYWQRRVHEEERVVDEYPEPWAKSELAKAQHRLDEAERKYAIARGGRIAPQPLRFERNAVKTEAPRHPTSLVERVWDAVKRLF